MDTLEKLVLIQFSALLRKERIDHGFSQKKLANATHLDRTFISLMERGLRGPSFTTVFLITNALSIPTGAFIDAIQEGVNFQLNHQN